MMMKKEERKINVVNVVKIGFQAIDVHLNNYIIAKSLTEKEVEVPAEEGMSDSDEEESPNMSLASITCIRQGCKENDKVTIQEKEMQPFTTRYIPPHLRNSGTIHNSQDIKPIILFEAITERMKPNTLKLKGSLKGKYITILVDSGSTHNFVDINLARQLNLFVPCQRSHGYNLSMANPSEELDDAIRFQ
jgi:hypothetical protein